MRTILVALAVAVMACEGKPESTAQTANLDFEVERLFTHDGCTVYRFYDGISRRYFVRCEGSSSVEWDESSGKVVIPRQVPTGYAK